MALSAVDDLTGPDMRLMDKFDLHGDRGGDPTSGAEMLRAYVVQQLQEMRRFREHIGLIHRLNNCLRQREGVYNPDQTKAIALFGGSAVFARMTANKIRGGAALLRSFFVQGERPWEIKPTPVPTLPDDVTADIEGVVRQEAMNVAQSGQPVDPKMIQRRIDQLMKAANVIARKQAREDAVEATFYIDDILEEGGFYPALNDFILDFCTMPFAIMRGPTATMRTVVNYVNGQPQRVRKAVLAFQRVDPYDFMWSPGSTCMDDADVIERVRMSRADVNALIGLEGYDQKAVRSVLRDYGTSGYNYRTDFTDQSVRDETQNLDDVFYSTMIEVLAYTGRMTGRMIREFEIPVPKGTKLDDDLDYMIQTWVCGRYVLKSQIDPDPANRIPYFTAAYEPVPGSIPGTALCELIADVQETYNAVLRALVNNVAMASGPQVVVNTTRWQPPPDNQVRIAPWMIWRVESDPTAPTGEKPVDFFQPNMNGGELINLLSFLQNLADEISGIPRYLTGSGTIGGAGRTSSGLSMLMSNATRTMTSVAGGIDNGVIEPIVKKTYDLVLLTTGTAVLRGDETIAPRGATAAELRENDRMRMIEFLQATSNPTDLGIMGVPGRANLLRHIANGFAAGEEIIPSEADIEAQQQAQQQQAALVAAQGGAPPPGGPGAPPGGPPAPGGAPAPPGGPVPAGQPQPGGTPAKPQLSKDPRNEAAQGTDNAHRTRSPAAVARSGKTQR